MRSSLTSAKPFHAATLIGIVRIITGLLFIYHGWEVFNAAKIQEYAQWEPFKNYGTLMPYIGKAAELIAGVLLLLGLLTRLACIMVIATMAYIAFVLGKGIVWYNDQHPFLFILIAVLFIATGPGKFSLDAGFSKAGR